MKLAGEYIYLEKVTDKKFSGNHPNNINVGYVLEGYVIEEPEEGTQFYLYPYPLPKMDNYPKSWTSVVQSIDFENMTLTTQNSVYKIIKDAPESESPH